MALDFFAGCVGGCAGLLASYPLDTVKVHMQMGSGSNSLTCLKEIMAKDSAKGLYRGVASPLGGIAFANAIVFGIYGNTLRRFEDQTSVTSQLVAGALAGGAQSLITSPVELAKTRMQLGMKGTTISCIQRIVREGGYRAVFQGLGITVLRDSPGLAVYFASYELLSRSKDGRPPSPAICFAAGGAAGAISWVVSYPMDVIKSRLQADGMSGQRQYSGLMDCVTKSIQRDGYKCFVRGFNTVMVRAFITNSVCFSAVNWVYRMAEKSRQPPVITPQRPRIHSWVYYSLVCTGGFSEAICESDVREIHDELMMDKPIQGRSVHIDLTTVFKETI